LVGGHGLRLREGQHICTRATEVDGECAGTEVAV
jgi:hypothetical protein